MAESTTPKEPADLSPEAAGAAQERLRASWEGWLAAIAGIPTERLEEAGVCGAWAVKDLFGHVAFWDRYAIERGRTVLAGAPFAEIDWPAMNEREAEAAAGRSPTELRREMEAAHAEMLAFIAAAPQTSELLVPMLGRMAVDTEEHYGDHAAEVRAWRERAGIAG